MRLPTVYLSTIVLLVVALPPAFGRLIESWPYGRLFKEADLVVIARTEGTVETRDRFSPKLWNVEFVGQETRFTVQAVLKGKSNEGDKVKVLHYRLPEGVLVSNGPLLVSFRKDPLALKGTVNNEAFKAWLGAPEYLLFLRARPDGRFEPVSGQADPALSVREIHEPDQFLSKLGRE
jgi:hypothetical protein